MIPNGWTRWMPGLRTLEHYQLAWLPHDIIAGLVLTTMLVPVGIAYAVASGVPGIYGLYATIVPLIAYALFGPSRIMVLGPDSSLAAIILGVMLPLSGGDPMRAVALAGAMAIVSGTVCILAGVVRLGFVTELLSKPIRYGYMNGIALTVLISQFPKLFGFSIESIGPLRNIWAIGEAVLDGRTNWAAFAVGAGTLAVILLLKGNKRVPGILVAVIGATIVGQHASISPTRAGVSVLGPLPQGLPHFAVPWITLDDLAPIIIGGMAVAMVSFADTSVLSRVYAARTGSTVDPSQEMVGLGAANLAAGFFQGFPISSSSSRTPVAEAAGARTQLTGVVGAIAVAPAPSHRAGSPPVPAVICPCCRRDRVRDRPDRGRGSPPDLPYPAMGVLALDRLLRGCRRPRRYPRHRRRHRHRRHRVSMGRLEATLGGARPRRWREGLS